MSPPLPFRQYSPILSFPRLPIIPLLITPIRFTSTNSTRTQPTPRTRRTFSTTRISRASTESLPNHYETLQLPHDATTAQIKKQFYTLSKIHHPDRTTTHDPSRFHAINDAYHTLSSPTARSEYDRQFLSFSSSFSSTGSGGERRSGSYSSAAGGRSPSGLSRRRASFRGPPESFYRQGAWGVYGDKRAESQAKGHASSSSADSSSFAGAGAGAAGAATEEGAEEREGDAEYGFTHWNRRAHLKSQSDLAARFDSARRERAARYESEAEEGVRVAAARDALMRFLVLGGMLGVILMVPVVMVKVLGEPSERRKVRKNGKGDG